MHLNIVLFLVALLGHYAAADVKVICYYASWSAYNGYTPEDFDPKLCTHVNYAFMGLWDDGNVKVEDDNLDIDERLYYRVTDWKKKNPTLKVLLSVGGGSDEAAKAFSGMAANSGKKGAFIGSASYFISTLFYFLKDNFMKLLQDLKTAFKPHGWLLTAAVTANPEDGYDVKQMNNLLDYFNVMTYDMYGSWSSYTGQTSPLYASHVESDWEKHNLNIDACSHNWICERYSAWTRVWDNEQKNPYKYSGNQWFGYDDSDSIWIKTDYIKDNGFFGVMIWAIDGDDVHGICGMKQNLLKHINGALGKIDCC
ncbi:hypothetical protein NQ314_019259 [Rhamnusium bicolor]|uniref:GH18 domain-containing protein n=1 Tax=Rhamnusium bicolor TaxID=1586634 RepID=A0AAV8WR35_9CUCU|nr:hypothetical protein NQ314_019259 [Rhamnusium bicolor]